MAQGDHRPRHQRQPSRFTRVANHKNGKNTTNGPSQMADFSDHETISYIRQVLCGGTGQQSVRNDKPDPENDNKSLEDLLPPLTSSHAVDVQLYAIIAAILSQFVQSWYNRITPDHGFVAEVVQIIAHCTRGLEERFRHVDLEDLFLDELPALVITHVEAYGMAKRASNARSSTDDFRLIYHTIRPNKALTPLPNDEAAALEQADNEIAWSQLLVSRILPLLLPPEDFANPCLHVLVSEVFSEMIVRHALCSKASEPWIIWEGVTKLLNTLSRGQDQNVPATSLPAGRLEQFGLLSATTSSEKRDLIDAQHQGRLDAIAWAFWRSLQMIAVGWLLLRSFVTALMHGSSIPARQPRSAKDRLPNKVRVRAVDAADRPVPQHTIMEAYDKRAVISMRAWSCISTSFRMEQRMPWLCGLVSLLRWILLFGPGRLCETNSILDRLMASQIHERVSRPDLLPSVLQAIRSALFRNNTLAAARQPPTAAEVVVMKRECAEAIVNILPTPIRQRFFATKDHDLMRQDIESDLDLFADAYINKHLIISAVELIVARLFPELTENNVDE